MITFYGERIGYECNVYYSVSYGMDMQNLHMYLDEVNHSPTGFEWGYGGSGPAQLAYAILRTYYSHMDVEKPNLLAMERYYHFKEDVISRIPRDMKWQISGEKIRSWEKTKGYETIS